MAENLGGRSPVGPDQLAPYSKLAGAGVSAQLPAEFPNVLNPMFGVVFARYVRERKGSPVLHTATEIECLVDRTQLGAEYPPDLVVLGDSVVIIPALGNKVRSPFFIPGKSSLHVRVVDRLAFGVAFTSIMAALDWIQLGVLPWHRITVDALGIPFE